MHRWVLGYVLSVALFIMGAIAAWEHQAMKQFAGELARAQESFSHSEDKAKAAAEKSDRCERGLAEAREELGRAASAREAAEVALKNAQTLAATAAEGPDSALRVREEMESQLAKERNTRGALERAVQEARHELSRAQIEKEGAQRLLNEARDALEKERIKAASLASQSRGEPQRPLPAAVETSATPQEPGEVGAPRAALPAETRPPAVKAAGAPLPGVQRQTAGERPLQPPSTQAPAGQAQQLQTANAGEKSAPKKPRPLKKDSDSGSFFSWPF